MPADPVEPAGAEARVARLASLVPELDHSAEAAASERQSRLLKPAGSLGRLEALGIRLAAIGGRCPPPVPAKPALLVAAGDHGVVAQGVTPWPQAVTGAMVTAMTAGQAAVNAIAGAIGAELRLLDAGVAAAPPPHPMVRQGNVRRGTADLAVAAAMTREQAALAVLEGAAAAGELLDAGADLLLTGDMGIGNTTAAACLIAALTGLQPVAVTGRGTGIDDATWELKVKVVERALRRHAPDAGDPLGVLASVGGLEHGALAGLALAGAARRVPVLLDGVNAGAAALLAVAIQPRVAGFLIAGHRSVEPGASAAMEHLGLEPLLDLRMRLGEGTGALLAVPIVRSAAAVLGGMATFAEAGLGGAATAHTLSATLVSEHELAGHREPGDSATVKVTLDASVGCRNLVQRVLRFAAGRSTPRRTACEEVWFVVAGRGTLLLDGLRHALEPEVGVLLEPGASWQLDNPGEDDLVVVAVQVPGAREPLGAAAAPPVLRLADRPAMTTGDREFRILVDPEIGCQGVTQFVGWIPPGRAPTHHHSYEEVVYVLEGEGLLHLGESNRPIGPGSCVHLPPPVEHCLENTGTGPLRVLGVFHPAGSPASKTETGTT